jgi:hypothetical protein
MRYLVVVCVLMLNWRAAAAQLKFDFSGESGGSLTNFQAELLGGGVPPEWKILPGEAPSAFAPLTGSGTNAARGGGGVLAQTSQDPTDERFPMCVYQGDKFRNFRLAAQFKIVSGVTEQMAGLVFRYQNVSNFYVVRVSLLGKNIRFYKVVNGFRSDPIGPSCTLAPGWHQLAVQCEGTQIAIWLDGQLAMPILGDTTFTEGRLGFWTKSDSVTYFANAVVDYTPVIPAAQALVNSVLRQEPRILGLQIYTFATNNPGTNLPVILASKDPAECGQPGTDAELAAIRDGTVSFGRESDGVLVTLPLHDRNGEFIAAVRVKLKTFFGETQDNAVNRAMLILKLLQLSGLSRDDLMN